MSSHDEPPTSRTPAADKAAVEALVAACIEALERGDTSPAERVCGDRPDLLRRVQQRLAQLAQRGLIPATDPSMPAAIGPYRVLRTLGSGGMGTVYLAEQPEPVRRKVALKVVKLGMDTREVVARFQAERQALALMNHPNIAQVFDAGMTAEGRPYFAMEYVDGHPLTSICDAKALPPTARVRLFATVCRAVQHAHDRGFIHRDLKPSNILVVEHEGQLVPKVIDFGIAKATAVATADAATMAANLRTRADQILGTPEYMSPEQAISGGVDVDTRTDVYSLGVTLYELLCGELPFDGLRLRHAPRSEFERILLDELPTLPSRRLSSVEAAVVAARGGERSTVCRTVAGELDWITLRALAKARDERYPSPLALAEDLERWLAHEPVQAAPPGRTYRLRKFVRRHRVAVVATAAVLVSLVAGLVVSVNATIAALAAQAHEATALADMRAFYALARDAVGNLVGVADEQLADVPAADQVRKQLLADAIAFYESLRAREPDDPALRIDLTMASEHVGVLQQRLGQVQDAVVTLQRTDADVATLLRTTAADARLDALSITTPAALARAYASAGRPDDAKVALERALAALERVRARGTAPPVVAAITDPDGLEGKLLANLAVANRDDPLAAAALFERALSAHDRSASPTPQSRRERARCAGLYAEALTRQNRLADAARVLTDALAAVPAAGEDTGRAARTRREDEAALQDQLATVLKRLGRRTEARAAQHRAVERYAGLAAEHPEVPGYADSEAAGLHFLAQLAQDDAETAAAIELMDRAVAIRDRLAASQPQDYRLRMRGVRSLLTKANLEIEVWQHHAGSRAAADATLATATQRIDALYAAHGDDADVVMTFAAVHQAAAAMQNAAGERTAAIAEYVALRDALTAKLPQWPHDAELHYQLALVENNLLQAHYLERDFAGAAAAGERGLAHLAAGLQADARHAALLELATALAARTATAHFAVGNEDAGLSTLTQLLDRPEWGNDAVEFGALLLAEQLRHAPPTAPRARLLDRAAQAMRHAIAERGPLERALARPPQIGGISHVESRLRDLDLRLTLADLHVDGLDDVSRHTLLDEALRIADSMPELDPMRLRNLGAQRAELALREHRPAAAVDDVEHMLARIGPGGGGCYLAALLLAKSSAGLTDAAAKDRAATRAVECLRLSLAQREVDPDVIRHPDFAPLRGRDDFAALLRQ